MWRARRLWPRPTPSTRSGRERRFPCAGYAAQAHASSEGADFVDPTSGSGGVSTGSATPRRSIACPSTRPRVAKTAPARSVAGGCRRCRRAQSPNGQAPLSPDASTSGRVRSGRRFRRVQPLGADAGQSLGPHVAAIGPQLTSNPLLRDPDRSDRGLTPTIDPSQARGVGQAIQARFAVKQSLI